MAQKWSIPGSERIISGMKPLLLLVGVAAAIAAGVGVMLWSVGPTYSLLYSNLAAEDTAQITQALESAGIPYKLENGVGAISVPAEQLAAARLKLAVAGPARKRRRRECHDARSGLRRQRVHGKRALPACARNRTRAHHRQPAERAGRARAPGHGAAVRVRERAPAGQSRRCSCRSRPAAVSTTRTCRPSPISWPPAFPSSQRIAGHGGRPERPPAVGARDRQRHRDARQDVRVLASPRRKLFAIASRRC